MNISMTYEFYVPTDYMDFQRITTGVDYIGQSYELLSLTSYCPPNTGDQHNPPVTHKTITHATTMRLTFPP